MENKPRVLPVDVEESFVRILAPGLHDEFEFDVSVAESGHEAVEMMKTSTMGFDVVVPDSRMPAMPGLDALRRMNVHKIETPSFMLTAAGSESIAVEVTRLGA